MSVLDNIGVVKFSGQKDTTKLTRTRANYGKNNYTSMSLGSGKAIDGTTYNVTVYKFINKIRDTYKHACRLHNERKDKTQHESGLDDAINDAKSFANNLWACVGYTGKYGVQSTINGWADLWQNGGSVLYGQFKHSVSDDDATKILWAIRNPVEYYIGMINADILEKGGGDDTNTNNIGDIVEAIKPIAKYALYGVGLIFIIKAIK